MGEGNNDLTASYDAIKAAALNSTAILDFPFGVLGYEKLHDIDLDDALGDH